jgi:hypothetical protein
MVVRLTPELSADVEDLNRWSIGGLTSDALLTIHSSLEETQTTLVEQIQEAYFFNRKTYGYIAGYSVDRAGEGNKFLKPPFSSDKNAVYHCTEDILFLSEELRKVSEIMFRIRTEPGVF